MGEDNEDRLAAPLVEKVERPLEGWQTKVMSRGGWLVLLRSILMAIPLFHLSIFKMPVGIVKRLDGLMRQFLWKGQGRGQTYGASIGFLGDCVSTYKAGGGRGEGGLGVLHIQSMNTALLTKWVERIIGPRDNLAMSVLRDSYGRRLNWES